LGVIFRLLSFTGISGEWTKTAIGGMNCITV
jgi:hypothetical protein